MCPYSPRVLFPMVHTAQMGNQMSCCQPSDIGFYLEYLSLKSLDLCVCVINVFSQDLARLSRGSTA
jgi:hypothetical protein